MSNDPHLNPSAPDAQRATARGIVGQRPGGPPGSGSAGGARNKALLIAGIVVLLAGLVGGVVAFSMSGSAAEEAVENLARAPAGCTTRLDFDKAGTFTAYVETKGSANVSRGSCPRNEEDYERDSDDLPDVDLVLVPEDSDDEVDLDDDDSKSYDAAGARGQSISTFEIEEAGRYMLTVASADDETDFAVAIGKDPEAAADTLQLVGTVLVAAGVLVGALLIVLGLRRRVPPGRGPAPSATSEPAPPAPAAPVRAAAHTPPPPPPFGGGFGPPPSAPPTDRYPPGQPMPAPKWPAPPTS